MKILHVINSLSIGGAEKLMLELLPLMRKHGQVDILTIKESDSFISKKMTDMGFKIYSVGSSSCNIYNPIAIFKIIPFLRKYDIIHTHLFPTQYWVVLAKFISFSSVKIITTEHNTTNRRRKIKFFNFFDRLIYRCYDKIICISDQAYTCFVNDVGFAHKVCTIFNGVNLNLINESKPLDRSDLKIKNIDKLIIMVAGFRPQKDQDTLIKAVSKLPPQYKLLLVGDGERRSICEALVKDLSISDRVFFLGIRHDVPQLLKISDLVVMSSHYEGLSLSSIEGMFVKPFIASNVPGLREIVEGYGLLFEEGNVNALVDLIKNIIDDDDFYSRVSNLCNKRAQEYDINKMLKSYIDLYENLLKENKKDE